MAGPGVDRVEVPHQSLSEASSSRLDRSPVSQLSLPLVELSFLFTFQEKDYV